MLFEIKLRKSIKSNSLEVFRCFNKYNEVETSEYKDIDYTQGYTIAILTITESQDGNGYWCKCRMVAEQENDKCWNYKANTLEEAKNIGTLYALRKAGILFHIERKEYSS